MAAAEQGDEQAGDGGVLAHDRLGHLGAHGEQGGAGALGSADGPRMPWDGARPAVRRIRGAGGARRGPGTVRGPVSGAGGPVGCSVMGVGPSPRGR